MSFALKVRWSSSKSGDVVPQCVKLVLFKYFSPKIRTGPYVWWTQRWGSNDFIEEKRIRNRNLAMLNEVFHYQVLTRHFHWDGKGVWQEEKEWCEITKKIRREECQGSKRTVEARGQSVKGGSQVTEDENWELVTGFGGQKPLPTTKRRHFWLEWYKWKTIWEAWRS